MAVQVLPIGPDVPDELKALLQSMRDAIVDLQQPGAPPVDFTIDTAANLLSQAPADDHRGSRVIVTDKLCMAISVETTPGTWAWMRADGTAL